MAFPTTPLDVRVSIACGQDPSGDPAFFSWTTITSYVYVRGGIIIKRGRESEQSLATPSTLSLTLDNRDGRFTPSNPTGAYYGTIGKNTPIRIEVNAGSGYVTRFVGFISEWPPRWDVTGNDRYVPIRAEGILRRLNQGTSPIRSDLYHTITTDAFPPLAYWPLTEVGREVTEFEPAYGRVAPLVAGPASAGSHRSTGVVSGSVEGAYGSGSAVDMSKGGQLTGTVPNTTSTEWRVDLNVLFTDPVLPAESGQVLRIHTITSTGVAAVWGIFCNDTAGSELTVEASGSGFNSATYSLILDDGNWHHVSFRVLQSGANSTWELWLDGRFDATGTWAEPFGKVTKIVVSPTGDLDAVGHLAFWDAWGNTDYAIAAFGHIGETAVDRINRLCAAENVELDAMPAIETFIDPTLSLNFSGTWFREIVDFWAYRSAVITHGQTSDTDLTVPANARRLQFWYGVSSEANFDLFQVYVDGVFQFQASGQVNDRAVLDVTGHSTVKFRYTKDGTASSGDDMAWITDVAFSSSVAMGPQKEGSFVGLLDECQAADYGSLYETKNGKLGYHDKTYLYNAEYKMLLYYDQGHISPPFEPVDDDQETRNELTVQASNGAAVQVSDDSHITRYGRYASQSTVNVNTMNDLIDNAGWQLHLGTNEKLRYPQVVLNFATNPALITSWLDTELDDRLRIFNPPAGLPPGEIELVLRGYTEVLGLYEWAATLDCTPAELYEVTEIGDLTRLDSNSSTLTSSITSTQTSFSVTTTDTKDLWTTNGLMFPLSVMVGGEEISINSITGTSSPQTFNVTRSINGVVKSHSAGAEVHAADPVVLAF